MVEVVADIRCFKLSKQTRCDAFADSKTFAFLMLVSSLERGLARVVLLWELSLQRRGGCLCQCQIGPHFSGDESHSRPASGLLHSLWPPAQPLASRSASGLLHSLWPLAQPLKYGFDPASPTAFICPVGTCCSGASQTGLLCCTSHSHCHPSQVWIQVQPGLVQV